LLAANKFPPPRNGVPVPPLGTSVSKPRLCHTGAYAGAAFAPSPQQSGGRSLDRGLDRNDDLLPILQGRVNPARNGPGVCAQEIDPLYLFACQLEWERSEEPSAAWELLAAAKSFDPDTRAHARALLSSSRHLGGMGLSGACKSDIPPKRFSVETHMNSPYGLDIVEDCARCTLSRSGFFCGFSNTGKSALDRISHKSTLPAGAILFVEGQSPRGVFILCSGRVNLSTTSREGKILILKTAEAGECLGLSAAISAVGYEATAETATPCQLNYVGRKHLLELIASQSEVGMHATQCLSNEFQTAYRDIHDLVLTRTSSGKLAKLLLLHSPSPDLEDAEVRIQSPMTHEEMAQRIGASRETVTRLLSDLKRRHLIRHDGPTIVIRSRAALQALAV
jgi:CRP/FNR family cyclic AMP-dependent transcriptional regulator